MTIDSLDDFKRVVIENNYEFDGVDDIGRVTYKYRFFENEERWAAYSNDGTWVILFFRRNTLLRQFGDYEDVVERIKDNCSYVGIEEGTEYDYVSYKCEESKLDGKIGFTVAPGGRAIIKYFPNK